MKKIYLAIGITASMMLSSCSDFLDQDPSVELPTESAITTTADLRNAINGIPYSLMEGSRDGRMTYASEFSLFADTRCNDFKVTEDNNQLGEIRLYKYNSKGTFNDYGYYYYYHALGNVNNALQSIEKGQVEGDADVINDYKGQLLAWRGMLHFDLARMFCHIPTTVENPANELGLVISDQVFDKDYKGTRTDLASTYTFIIKQFTDALSLLGKKKENGYFNYYAALGLRARAYLYNGQYAEALADAKEVIEKGNYKMLTRDSYVEAWSKENADETILELLQTDKYNEQRYAPGYYCDATGYSENAFNENGYLYQYLKAKIDTIKEDNAVKQIDYHDIRAALIKNQAAASYKKAAGYYPNKFPGRNGNLYVNNIKLLRLSEMYLIAAEAQWHLDNPGSYDVTKTSANAAQYINAIDENRIENYTAKATVTLADILHEYEIEMFCENQITFAYWRNHQSVTNQAGQEVKYNDYNTIMAIPQAERDYNPALQQNPEY